MKRPAINSPRQLVRRVMVSDFWSTLIRNTFTSLWGTGGANVINLITLLIMVNMLGNTNYGLFVLAQQYMVIVDSLVNFQSWQGVIKFGSEAVVDKNDSRLASIIKYGFTIDIVSAAAGLAVSLMAIPIVGRLLQWDAGLLFLAVIFSLEIVVHLGGTPTGVLRLFNKFNLVAIHAVALAFVRLAAVAIYALFAEVNLKSFVILYVCVDLVKHIALLAIAAHIVSQRVGLRKVAKSKLGYAGAGFLRYTLWSNIGSTADIPIKYFDVFIISKISVELVAIYKVFKQIIQVFSMLTTPIAQAIMPQLAELIARKEDVRAYQVVLKLRNFILTVLLPITVLCSIVAEPCFRVILGPEYAEQVVMFIVLLLINDFALSYVALHPFFAALGKVREDFFIILGTNIVYLVVAFLLVGILGIYGIILGTALQYVLTIYSKTYLINRSLSRLI
ncbi:Inner membrane protein YghQ [Sporotomaculum syntrophicum]|uniref:Inner membrane protein YghQ n=1 Tax=Sporotomaculum syntrophicum TaxID=182264 RepID=A0A9D3AZ23_9FIRM|nr:oligosaccharide flippase family protein [Sporotomaculum syntrophicum]KAF1086096.1 Inner membrane protein YghQ [Sporotomaculum syntrophicum]